MKVAYGSTIAKFVLTSLLYEKSTFHMLWLVVQMNELMNRVLTLYMGDLEHQ